MKSLFDFIVKPLNKRYDTDIKVGDKSLITNTNTEDGGIANFLKSLNLDRALYQTINPRQMHKISLMSLE